MASKLLKEPSDFNVRETNAKNSIRRNPFTQNSQSILSKNFNQKWKKKKMK